VPLQISVPSVAQRTPKRSREEELDAYDVLGSLDGFPFSRPQARSLATNSDVTTTESRGTVLESQSHLVASVLSTAERSHNSELQNELFHLRILAQQLQTDLTAAQLECEQLNSRASIQTISGPLQGAMMPHTYYHLAETAPADRRSIDINMDRAVYTHLLQLMSPQQHPALQALLNARLLHLTEERNFLLPAPLHGLNRFDSYIQPFTALYADANNFSDVYAPGTPPATLTPNIGTDSDESGETSEAAEAEFPADSPGSTNPASDSDED
jgi:hypothetical protein